jgi:hypothetical protein
MASRETRVRRAAAGACSLCLRPQMHLAESAFDAACEAVCHGAHPRSSVAREHSKGVPEVRAEGYEEPVARRHTGDGKRARGHERRLMMRSVR